jgi:hypothetical protein
MNERIGDYVCHHTLRSSTTRLHKMGVLLYRAHSLMCLQVIGDQLGRGGFASVYKALNLKTGEFVAIKELPIDDIAGSEQLATLMVCRPWWLSSIYHRSTPQLGTTVHGWHGSSLSQSVDRAIGWPLA